MLDGYTQLRLEPAARAVLGLVYCLEKEGFPVAEIAGCAAADKEAMIDRIVAFCAGREELKIVRADAAVVVSFVRAVAAYLAGGGKPDAVAEAGLTVTRTQDLVVVSGGPAGGAMTAFMPDDNLVVMTGDAVADEFRRQIAGTARQLAGFSASMPVGFGGVRLTPRAADVDPAEAVLGDGTGAINAHLETLERGEEGGEIELVSAGDLGVKPVAEERASASVEGAALPAVSASSTRVNARGREVPIMAPRMR